MKQKYPGTTKVKRVHLQALRKEFQILQMKARESVNEYFARSLIIANKMRIHGEVMQEVTIIEKILPSITHNSTMLSPLLRSQMTLIRYVLTNFMTHLEDTQAQKEDAWFLDLGCSSHMCGKKELMETK